MITDQTHPVLSLALSRDAAGVLSPVPFCGSRPSSGGGYTLHSDAYSPEDGSMAVRFWPHVDLDDDTELGGGTWVAVRRAIEYGVPMTRAWTLYQITKGGGSPEAERDRGAQGDGVPTE